MDDLPVENPLVNAIQAFVLLEKQKRTATAVPTHCYRYSVIVIHWGVMVPRWARGIGRWLLYAASWLTFDSSQIVWWQQNCSWSQLK